VGSSLQRRFLRTPGIHDCGTARQGCTDKLVFENIRTALVATGVTMSDIDGRDLQALSRPDVLIEVEVMAVIPER
jgi:hypothetical protein